MYDSFDLSGLVRAWPYLWDGIQMTVMLTVVSAVLGLLLGIVLALVKMYGRPWAARLATWYVDFFRSIPLILTIFWAFFLLPMAARWLTGKDTLDIGPVYAALIAFVMAEAAYFCEIIRGGIKGVAPGQVQAALSLGMTRTQALRLVVLPQAIRHMTPSLVTQTIGLLMDTSLVYVISLNDFLGAASKVAQRDGTLVEVYLFVALVYLLVCSLGTYVAHLLRPSSAARQH